MPVDEKQRKENFKKRRTRTPTRRERAKEKGRENPQPVMRGTTTMGPVLDSLQDPLAEERSQENIDARLAALLDTLHINAARRKTHRRPQEGLGSQGQGHQCEGLQRPYIGMGPTQIKETNQQGQRRGPRQRRTPWRETQEEKIHGAGGQE